MQGRVVESIVRRRARLPAVFENIDLFGIFPFDVFDIGSFGERIVKPERVADARAHRLATRLVVSVRRLTLALDDRLPIFVVAANLIFVIDLFRLHQTCGKLERAVGDLHVVARKERGLATSPRGIEVPPFLLIERVAVEFVAQFRGVNVIVPKRADGRIGARGRGQKERRDES